MNRLTKAHQRLQEAGDLAAVIAAAHEGFVAALTALRAREDPDSAWFGEFVMAAASAADGRDALLFAPSMPAIPGPGTRVTDEQVLPVIQGERGGVIAGERVHDVNGPARLRRAGPGVQGVAGMLSLSR